MFENIGRIIDKDAAGLLYLLAIYEFLAPKFGKPSLTKLSRTPLGIFVWISIAFMVVHLLRERR